MRRRLLATIVLFLGASTGTSTQSPAAKPQAPAGQPNAAAAPAQAPPAPAENYTYQAEGRRDPFVNLLGTGAETRASAKKGGDGVGSISVSDISVRGLMESRGALLAIVAAPDHRTYIVRAGDKFEDGTIRAVTSQGLVVVQEVNDPLSLVKQREIRKLLRSAEDTKK